MFDTTPALILAGVVIGSHPLCNPAGAALKHMERAEENGPARSPLDAWNQWATFLFPSPHGPLKTLRVEGSVQVWPATAQDRRACTECIQRARLGPRGVDRLTFELEKDGDRRRKSEHPTEADISENPRSQDKQSDSPELGLALRTVYQRTVEEDIPPEMLDLLGKLG
jgi:hypothetical protein